MSYPISTPVTFDGTGSPGAPIDFNPGGSSNEMENFVVTTAGDMLFRQAVGANYLDRLPIGPVNYVLQSTGTIPVWTNAIINLSQGTFMAVVTASTLGIPTSRITGTWHPLAGVTPYVTWMTGGTPPANDPDGVFSLVAGATYGQFIVPATGAGTYTLSAQITFDSGVGVNAGSGIPGGLVNLPGGMAVRQAQIYNATTSTAIGVASVQNSGSNNNQTVVWVMAENVTLAALDAIEIRVRHDRNAANTVTIGNPAIAVFFQTYFTGKRIL